MREEDGGKKERERERDGRERRTRRESGTRWGGENKYTERAE